MRTIKLRAWYDHSQTWVYFTIGEQMTDLAKEIYSQLYISGAKWLQFTGINDTNGKEIYVGDICGYGEIHNKGIVKCGSFRYMDGDLNPYQIGYYFQRTKQTCSDDTCQDSLDQTNIKVIGNIHENPELLKQ